jgi:uncharacterized protein YggU (UPF0235/DUF167 family)
VLERGAPDRGGDDVLRVEVHVRPRSATTAVAGTHDGILVVRVVEPAHDGRANRAVLRALVDALGLPHRSARLLRGAAARRKVIGLSVPPGDEAEVEARLERLRSGGGQDGRDGSRKRPG